MKKTFAIVALSLLALSCETEETVIKNSPANNLVGNTALSGKLRRMAQSPTTADNMIDNSSCFAINFPYSVVANGEPLTLQSEAGYQAVRNVLNQNAGGSDVVTIDYPIAVTYDDYTEGTLSTQAQFNQVVAACTGSVELSCMSFAYPLGVKSYNSQNQLAQSFNLGNKQALFELIETLDTYDAVEFSYPVIFNAPDGLALTIQNNQELEAAIDTYTEQCMELLNPEPGPVFEEVIVQGSWYISYFFMISDQTASYADYDFAFSSNGTILVTADVMSPGAWIVNAGQTEVGLAFMDPALIGVGPDQYWTITSITETQIEMHIDSTGTDPERYMTLSKN